MNDAMAEPDSLYHLMASLRVLPGVGLKTSQRMALQLLSSRHREEARQLAEALLQALEKVRRCRRCRILSEAELCRYCASGKRDTSQICVVESDSDVLALEQTDYQGVYFVLQGYLSPLDGVTPQDLGIDLLLSRLNEESCKEVILATNLTVEGETTAHYIKERLANTKLKISRIAHGVPMGGELEYMDGSTLSLALMERKAYQ